MDGMNEYPKDQHPQESIQVPPVPVAEGEPVIGCDDDYGDTSDLAPYTWDEADLDPLVAENDAATPGITAEPDTFSVPAPDETPTDFDRLWGSLVNPVGDAAEDVLARHTDGVSETTSEPGDKNLRSLGHQAGHTHRRPDDPPIRPGRVRHMTIGPRNDNDGVAPESAGFDYPGTGIDRRDKNDS